MRRIGIIGIENSHTDHFLRHLNTEHRFPGTSGTTILRGEPDRVAEITEAASVDVVETPEEVAGQVDAVIICSRDGALHRQQAEPALRAGLPVLIDKPLATSAADAEALIKLSAATGAPLLSASAVRFTPEVGQLEAAVRGIGDLRAVAVSGPADPQSPYSGIFFYGIHVVETAFQLLGAPEPDVDLDAITVVAQPSVVVVTVPISGVVLTLRFIVPDDDGRPPFHGAVFGRRGSAASDLTLGPDYNLPLLEQFVRVASGEPAPQWPGGLVAPIAVTERIRAMIDK